MNLSRSILAACLTATCSLQALADRPLIDLDCKAANGASIAVVRPGGAFDVVVSASSVLPLEINSALFRLVLTQPGIVIENYEWELPFQTGGFTDFSLVGLQLPTPITTSTLQGPNYPVNVNDIEFGNFLMTGSADMGELVIAHLRLPANAQPGEQFFVVASPDTFAMGFVEFSAVTHLVLTVKVTHAPDLNHDLQVDGGDLGALLGAWGSADADLNGDGATDGADLGILLSEWGLVSQV